MRYELGDPNRRCCSLPKSGHFLIYMQYDGRWICAVIDGASGYLDGYMTRTVGQTKDDLRIRESNEIKFKYIEEAKKMPDGGYVNAKYRKNGDEPLVEAFLIIYAHVEGHVPGPSRQEIIRAGETFILHFTEAAKSDILFRDNMSTNFRAMNRVGSKPIIRARDWRNSCATIYRALGIKDDEFGEKPKDTRRTQAIERVTTSSDSARAKVLLRDIRLLHRPNHNHGYFYLENMPIHLTEDGPVDPTWAENEIRESHKLDLGNLDWGFLTERFPAFHSPTNEERIETLLENAYIRTKDVVINMVNHILN